MSAIATLIVLRGFLTSTRRQVRERFGDDDVGASTLELVIIVLGLIAVAAIFVAVITAAVQRRLDQIN